MEINGAQIRFEDPYHRNRIMCVKGDNRISMPIIMCCIQNGLLGCEQCRAEQERINFRMEVAHRIMADASKVEYEGIAVAITGQGLIRNACNDRSIGRCTQGLSNIRNHIWTGRSRWIVDDRAIASVAYETKVR